MPTAVFGEPTLTAHERHSGLKSEACSETVQLLSFIELASARSRKSSTAYVCPGIATLASDELNLGVPHDASGIRVRFLVPGPFDSRVFVHCSATTTIDSGLERIRYGRAILHGHLRRAKIKGYRQVTATNFVFSGTTRF